LKATNAVAKAVETAATVVDPSLKPGGQPAERPRVLKQLGDGLKELAIAIRVFGDSGQITDADPEVVRRIRAEEDQRLHRPAEAVAPGADPASTTPADTVDMFVHPKAPDGNARWAYIANQIGRAHV